MQAIHTTQASQHSLPPLQALLKADSSPDLTTGFSGALDPAGWRLEVAHDGAPVFRSVGNPIGPQAPSTRCHAPGPGLGENVNAIAVAGPDVYVGGCSIDAGGDQNADRIARWDGSSWHPLGSGLNGWVRTIAMSGPNVNVGGDFTDAGGNAGADRVARCGTVFRYLYLPLALR